MAFQVANMMYGFGDASEPLNTSIDLIEDATVAFIQEMTAKAWKVQTRPGKMSAEDVLFVIRKDKKKYHRAIELLQQDKKIKSDRKTTDDSDISLARQMAKQQALEEKQKAAEEKEKEKK